MSGLPSTVPFVPSKPDPQIVTLVAALLRWILTGLAGAGVIASVVSDSTLMLVASSIVGAGTVAWSLWQKFQAARRDHAGSVRSAAVGQPVKMIPVMAWRFALDPHPFARGGSYAIVGVSAMHLVMAWLLLRPSSRGASDTAALLILLREKAGIGVYGAMTIMVGAALLALLGALFRLGWIRIAVLIPQQVILGIMAIGVGWAAWHQVYLDHFLSPDLFPLTSRPWNFITEDQCALWVLAWVHLTAINRRVHDPNG